MSTPTTLTAGLAAALVAAGLAAPTLARANDAAAMASDLPFALDDEQDEITFSLRNFVAYTGLVQASRADAEAAQTMTLFTADPGIITLDLDAHGDVLTFSSVGFGHHADLDLAIAAESLYGDLYGTGHITDGTGFMVDLEAETGIGIIGMADVIVEQQLVDMWVYVDPMVSVDQMLQLVDMAISMVLVGGCQDGGYVGELTDTTGAETGCPSFWSDDPVTGESDGDAISKDMEWGGFTGWAWNIWNWAQKKKEEREKKKEEKKKKKGNSIADWTEGPMFLFDQVSEVHLVGTFDVLLSPIDGSVGM